RVNLWKLHNQGYSFFMESVYRLHKAGMRVAEIPIDFHDRHAGESKIPRWEIFSGMAKLAHLGLSKALGRRVIPASEPIGDACTNCGSMLLLERFPKRVDAPADGNASSAYRCSSMAHSNKPRVAKCLTCGLAQVPRSEQPADLEHLYDDVVDEDYLGNLRVKQKTFA